MNPSQEVMRNIIVPIDFSESALKGLEMAILLSQVAQVKIQLIYVQKRIPEAGPGLAEEEHKTAERNFKKIIDKYTPELKNDSQILSFIKHGKVYQEIVSQAQAYPDSLIVASTHGASGFEELFIGSNAFRVVSATDRPVITIRNQTIPKTITKIVMGIDIALESRQKVMFTSYIAHIFNAEIHVVTISTSKSKKVLARLNAYSQQVCTFLKNREISFKTASLIGDHPTRMVIDYAESVGAELLSIINESGDSVTDLLIGSEAQQMISKASIPVLTIRAKQHTIKGSFSAGGA